METNLFAEIMHGLTLAGVVAILGFMLDQHGVYVRIKDRLDALWRDRCTMKGDEFVPLDGRERR